MASFSYPLAIPTNIGFANFDITRSSVVGVSRSPFTGNQQTQRHQGQWFELTASLPIMLRADADIWASFFDKLNGMEGTFLAGDPNATTAKGTAGTLGDTLLVNGAQLAGVDTLDIKGATINQTGYFLAGDYLSLGTGASTRLHNVTVNANSDASGLVTVDIWPRLRDDVADDDAITIASAKGIWRLANNNRNYSVKPPGLYDISFSAMEAL